LHLIFKLDIPKLRKCDVRKWNCFKTKNINFSKNFVKFTFSIFPTFAWFSILWQSWNKYDKLNSAPPSLKEGLKGLGRFIRDFAGNKNAGRGERGQRAGEGRARSPRADGTSRRNDDGHAGHAGVNSCYARHVSTHRASPHRWVSRFGACCCATQHRGNRTDTREGYITLPYRGG